MIRDHRYVRQLRNAIMCNLTSDNDVRIVTLYQIFIITYHARVRDQNIDKSENNIRSQLEERNNKMTKNKQDTVLKAVRNRQEQS